jgi:hypothetical protein
MSADEPTRPATTIEAFSRLSAASRSLGLAVVAPVWPAARLRIKELTDDEQFVAKAVAVGLGEEWARETLTHCTAVADSQGFSLGTRRQLIEWTFEVAVRDHIGGDR